MNQKRFYRFKTPYRNDNREEEKVQTIIDHKNVKIEKGEDDYNDIFNQISVSLTKVKERY